MSETLKSRIMDAIGDLEEKYRDTINKQSVLFHGSNFLPEGSIGDLETVALVPLGGIDFPEGYNDSTKTIQGVMSETDGGYVTLNSGIWIKKEVAEAAELPYEEVKVPISIAVYFE